MFRVAFFIAYVGLGCRALGEFMVITRIQSDADRNNHSCPAERRNFPRWAMVSRIFYQMGNDTTIHESQSVNISATGICFTTPELMPENIRIKMKIFLSDEAVIPVSGQIIWSKSENGDGRPSHQAAIRFSDISPRAQELILEHAFEVKKQDMVKYWFQGWEKK